MKKVYCLMILLLIALFAYANSALQCIVTVNKDPTWSKENVTVAIVDYPTRQTIQSTTLSAAGAAPSVNQTVVHYDCIHHPVVVLQASYTPSVWSTDKGAVYSSATIYDLTQQIAETKANSTLNFTINFPADFLGVPLLAN